MSNTDGSKQLPAITQTMVTDWINQLGDMGYATLLRLLTRNDVSTEGAGLQYIPQPFSELAADFKMTEKDLNALIRQYYEFGLLDLVKLPDGKYGIKVRLYPNDDIENAYKPLERLKNWDQFVSDNGIPVYK